MNLINIIFMMLIFKASVIESKINKNWKERPEWIDSIRIYFYSPLQKERISISNNSANFLGFNSKFPLKVLIHGWITNPDHISVSPIKNAYLAKGGINLVSVDWSTIASQVYDIPRNMILKIAARATQILKPWMKRMSIEPENVHILGHSLGAHIAGNIGKYFNGSIERITGLDPAGPLFRKSSPDGLMKTDGKFVDVIHTDGGVQGDLHERGHVDFYPNRGLPNQPGCYALDIITLTTCSHFRAPLLYAESIMLPYNFIAAPCDRKSLFSSIKKCKPKYHVHGQGTTVFMGEIISKDARGVYYLETNPAPPYGRGNYLIL